MWYFGHTGWTHFQTDQSTTRKQNDFKFQWSVFIFLNRGFHAFVLTKFPVSLFNALSWLPPYKFPKILSLFYCNTYFSWRDFWGVTSWNSRGILLCVWFLQRMNSYLWCFLLGALLIYEWCSFLFHHFILTRMNILIPALQGSNLVLTLFCIKS